MSAFTFRENEKVLCYHGPLLYEAKILKREVWDSGTSKNGLTGAVYFVHYRGWKQTWDEWVPPTRLLRWDEAGIQAQKGLQAAHHAKAAEAKTSSYGPPTSDKSGARDTGRRKERGTKRGRDEEERKPEMQLDVPEILKVVLVDDWEAVTKNNQVVQLPRSPTVVEILENFKNRVFSNPDDYKTFLLQDPKIVLPTIISGLIAYFDAALGQNLLYRFERPQYADIRRSYVTGPNVIVGQEKAMSAIYGAEHLLRMLVNLPQMVSGSTMDHDSMELIQSYVNALLKYMAENRGQIFVHAYSHTSLQYQNVSKS